MAEILESAKGADMEKWNEEMDNVNGLNKRRRLSKPTKWKKNNNWSRDMQT